MMLQSRFSSLGAGGQIALLFIVALAIGTGFVLALPTRLQMNANGDYFSDYKPTAENIMAGRGIIGADGQLELAYPPGYPVLLAIAYQAADALHIDRTNMIVAFNVLTGALSSVLVYGIADLLFGQGIGVLTWLLWVMYPPNLWTLLHPNSEVPFMLFLDGAAWVFCWGFSRRFTVAGLVGGIVLGAAALIRPIGLFLPLVFAFASLAYVKVRLRRRVVTALLVIIGFMLAAAPWESYVLAKTQRLIPLSAAGPGSMEEGLRFALTPGPDGERVRIPDHLRDLMEKERSEKANMKTMADILRFLREQAISNPEGFAQLVLLKLYRPWYGMQSKRHETATMSVQLVYLTFILMGLTLSFKIFKDRKFWVLFLCGLTAYLWGMAFLVVPLLRYMIPGMAFLMPFGAIGLHEFATRRRVRISAHPS